MFFAYKVADHEESGEWRACWQQGVVTLSLTWADNFGGLVRTVLTEFEEPKVERVAVLYS